jgi:hypothetical protein
MRFGSACTMIEQSPCHGNWPTYPQRNARTYVDFGESVLHESHTVPQTSGNQCSRTLAWRASTYTSCESVPR